MIFDNIIFQFLHRFVARRAGLAGRTDLEFVQADMVLFSFSYPFSNLLAVLFSLVAVLLDVDVVGGLPLRRCCK